MLYEKHITLSLAIVLIPCIPLQNTLAAEIVSLGSRCMTAFALRHNGLRTTAYPFDLMITSTQALTNAFQDDFKHVLELETTR